MLVSESDQISRPRPFGWGLLSDWRVIQGGDDAQSSDASRSFEENPYGSASQVLDEDFDVTVKRIAPGVMAMDFGEIVSFVVNFADRTVVLASAHCHADSETIDHFLDDHVAPRILAADGTLVLHGSAVLVGSRIAVFVGPTESGKSTLSASFHSAGHRLLGDDAVTVQESDGTFAGEVIYPSLRLFHESIEEVFPADTPTSSMAFYSDKRHVSVPELSNAEPSRYPIGAVFVINDGEKGVTLDRCSPSEACMALVENSFALDLLDGSIAAKRLSVAARMASVIPCYELAYPSDFALLPEIRRHVIAAIDSSSASD